MWLWLWKWFIIFGFFCLVLLIGQMFVWSLSR